MEYGLADALQRREDHTHWREQPTIRPGCQ